MTKDTSVQFIILNVWTDVASLFSSTVLRNVSHRHVNLTTFAWHFTYLKKRSYYPLYLSQRLMVKYIYLQNVTHKISVTHTQMAKHKSITFN